MRIASIVFSYILINFSTQAMSVSEVEKELRFIESMKEAQEKELRFLQTQNRQLRRERFELMGLSAPEAQPAPQRLPAATESLPSLNEQLSIHLQKHFQHSDFKVHIDPQSGSLNLSMKEFALFANNASELDSNAKSRLEQLVPKYFAALSSFPDFNKIKSVNIVGHASPVFQQRFVDPKGVSRREQEAYLFNLDISAYRAREIVKFLFDERFNSVKNIGHFRSRLHAVGKSFNHPIHRSPSSVETLCGPYDCDLSRRVELSVEFYP